MSKKSTSIYTWAQDSTPVNEEALQALEVYRADTQGELAIAGGRYKTQRSLTDDSGERLEWHPRVEQYLVNQSTSYSADVGMIRFEAGIPIQPTAKRPLSGLEQFAQEGSAIFGSPNIAFRPIPTEKDTPRVLCTTGAITEPNYTKSKAGARGRRSHRYGAAVVHGGKKQFHMRQLIMDGQNGFTDLDMYYSQHGVQKAPPATAIVLGDIHSEKKDPVVWDATLRLIDKVKPEKIVVHDVWDFTQRNHHSRSDPHIAYARYRNGYGGDSVEEGMFDALGDLKELETYAPVFVCASNHHDAADRWAKSVDGFYDPANKKFWHEMNYLVLDHYDRNAEFKSAFELLAKKKGSKATFLQRDQEFLCGKYICGAHGDKGINGSRGSIEGFSKLGVWNVTGHSHSPGIRDRAVQVGVTGARHMGYNIGPSTWMHSHFVIYANGEGSLVNIIDGKFE